MSNITIKDIAKLCGVGVSTVSRALNNHPDINPETKARIMQVIRETLLRHDQNYGGVYPEEGLYNDSAARRNR